MDTIAIAAKRPQRALVLDDSEPMREWLASLLDDLGIAGVMTGADGAAGLAALDAGGEPPELLFCDLSMPGMDGIEFLRHLAGRGYQGDVVLFSATDGSVLKAAERLARAHGLSLLGVLEKPGTPEALAALLAASACPHQARAGAKPEVLLTGEELRAGLAAGCVEVVFQPKVSVAARRVLGVECLARWRHAERGLLAPGAFIGVIEQQGLIDEFTLAVFRRAVAQQRAWRDAGLAIKINVNLSMDNLLRLDLPEVLAAIVAEAGLDARQLTLELTESRLMQNLKLGLDVLIRLRLMGFGLSIDDFGTGYATMESLKQLPFSELKVDRAFVAGAAEDPAARAILQSSVELGRRFGLNLVAEGVETQQDWDAVAALGCDEVQGYFVARPMSAAALPGWMRAWEGTSERNEDMGSNDWNARPRLLIVDDDMTMQEYFAAALEGNYRIDRAASGEEALRAACAAPPDAILLDVEMPPGIDGYEACRRLKSEAATAGIPVMFISARDGIDSRLRGYEAGGDDYLVKPFDPQEVEAKIVNLLKSIGERSKLRDLAAQASSTAITAMTSIGELGALLQALKCFNASLDMPSLATAVLAGVAAYGLHGTVQIRCGEVVLTRTEYGDANPIEVSVIGHLGSMERLTQFKSRLCVTYDHVSLLVHDMPIADGERCGRLRDHLAMLAEGAEARAFAIAADAEALGRGMAIEHAIGRITATLDDIDRAQRENQIATLLAVESFTQRMETAYVSVALSTAQEDLMNGILHTGLDQVLRAQQGVFGVQNQLSAIVGELREMAARPGSAAVLVSEL